MSETKAKNERVYQALKGDLINGVYPPDHHLDKDVLRQKYGFSTTPINFALVRLFNEGLLEKRGRDGFYTRRDTLAAEIKEIYQSTGAILKLAAAEYFTTCPNMPLKFKFDEAADVVATTERLFESVASLMGQYAFYSIIKANNDHLHLIRMTKAELIADREQELRALITVLEKRDLDAWSLSVDQYIARRLAILTELTQLTQQPFRAL